MLARQQQLAAFVDLFHSGTKLTYRKGEYIIRPGETPTAVFFIESGLVKALNISKYGEENLLIIRKENEIFPLIWSLTGEEHDIIYEAICPTVVWRLDHKIYLEHLKKQSSALPVVLDMVTEMYRIHSQRILNLEYRTVRERLISFLLTMSTRFGEQLPDGIELRVPLRHQDIASSINASRETASRELSYLEKRGYIKNKRAHILLLNTEALEKYL